MACSTWVDWLDHVNHRIEIAYYGTPDEVASMTVECLDCNEVLYDIPIEQEADNETLS